MLDTRQPQYRFRLVLTQGIEADEIKQAFDDVYRARNLHQAIMALIDAVRLLKDPTYSPAPPIDAYGLVRLGNQSGWRVEDTQGFSISFTWSFQGFG